MRTDTQDLVSITAANREFSKIARAVVQDGRNRVVLKDNTPTVAIVPMYTMDKLSRIEEMEEDLRMLAIAVVRSLTDSGVRHDLADVAAEFGIDLDGED